MGARLKTRHLVVVFGDQLDRKAAAFDGFDEERDRVWMAESFVEASHVWSNKNRIVLFFAAMRHFGEKLRDSGRKVHYQKLGEGESDSLGDLLAHDLKTMKPEKVVCTLPGEWRIREELSEVCRRAEIPLEIRSDGHFFDTPESFQNWAEGRRSLRLEYYYREMRKRHDILMTADGKPEGGQWNFDKDNRGAFGKEGPPREMKEPETFSPDKMTREVIALVEERFPDHPGELGSFRWPVTREEALVALADFIENRLPAFGTYQDALWTGEPWLYHSLVSSSLNLKLLNPREVIDQVLSAFAKGDAPLNAVEGFIRQIVGWREYVRGIYWWKMPDYLEGNTLGANEPLPDFYWSGETPYTCLQESLGQTLRLGYAHHIQRLMVTGLYGLLLGVDPKALHEWYLAVYVDAVEWVELPNVLGMSQYGDGGLMASKPYIATGKYIQRMGNYCSKCPANPAHATGEKACPFTTLYWDFLDRHEDLLAKNPRLSLQVRNLERKKASERAAIRRQAEKIRENPGGRED